MSDSDPVPLKDYLAALREADLRFNAERDRRLTEVAVEREKALKIKETADLAALQLARADQTYKDEQANKLREQINSERNIYVTQDQLVAAVREVTAAIGPLTDYVSKQQGGHDRTGEARLNIGAVLGGLSVLLVFVFGIASIAIQMST
jgi:hypothetical protein